MASDDGRIFLLTCSALLQSASASTLSLSRIALAGVMMGAILGLSVTAALNALPPPQHGQGIGIAWTLHNLGAHWGWGWRPVCISPAEPFMVISG